MRSAFKIACGVGVMAVGAAAMLGYACLAMAADADRRMETWRRITL